MRPVAPHRPAFTDITATEATTAAPTPPCVPPVPGTAHGRAPIEASQLPLGTTRRALRAMSAAQQAAALERTPAPAESVVDAAPTTRHSRTVAAADDASAAAQSTPTDSAARPAPLVRTDGALPSRRQLREAQASPAALPSRSPSRPLVQDGATSNRRVARPTAPTTTTVRRRRVQQATTLVATLAIISGTGYGMKAVSGVPQPIDQAADGQENALGALNAAFAALQSSAQVEQALDERELERSNQVSRQLQATAMRQSQAVEVAAQALAKGQTALERSRDVMSRSDLGELDDTVAQLQASLDAGDISGMVQLAEQVNTGADSITEAMRHLDPSLNGKLPDSYLCEIPFATGFRLRCDATEALVQLNEAFKAEFGHDMTVDSAYRTYAEQASTRATRGWWAAAAGTSNHGWGTAIDFSKSTISGYGTTADAWLKKNAPAYGWIRPDWATPGSGSSWHKPEYWHWEFVGTGDDTTAASSVPDSES